MKFQSFPSPHCHVASLDTASTLDDFVRREVELQTGTLTCTDHGYLGACKEIYNLAKENNLTPIIGIEGYFRDDDCKILKDAGIAKDPDGTFTSAYKYGHITIHALDQKAYEFLIKKVSDRDYTAEQHGSERKPIFNWQDLEEIGAQNVTYTTGCLIGIVGRHFKEGRLDLAEKYYEKLRSFIKPENFYVELFTHKCDKNWVSGVFLKLEGGQTMKFYLGKKVRTEEFEEISVADLSKAYRSGKKIGKLLAIKNNRSWDPVEPKMVLAVDLIQDFMQNECTPWNPDGDIQKALNLYSLDLAKKYGDKVIISDDAHYAFPEEKIVQDARLGGMGDSFRFYGKYHRHSSDEAFAHFQETLGFTEGQFREVLDNNIEWASKFKTFNLEHKTSLPVDFYPKDTLKHLMELIEAKGRMDWSNQVMVDRLRSEIDLLHNNGTIDLIPYFFLAEESIKIHEDEGIITGSGRGSAAGMLIAYLLGITHVNPLDHDLSQDRFLTADRIASGKLPDIDQDFPNRDVLNPWLTKRFGANFAQVSTDGKLHLKSSIKDVARATWGSVPDSIEQLCKTIPSTPQGVDDLDFINGYVSEDMKEVKGLLASHDGLKAYIKTYPEQWKIVLKMLGVTRSKGRHASAVVIANKPIDSFIPVMTIGGFRATQYTYKSCEESGALKMDYLSLNTLKDIQGCIKLIQSRNQIPNEKHFILGGKKVPAFRTVPFEGGLYDIWKLPERNEVFNAIANGDNETVFQLNTNSAKIWMNEFNYWTDNTKTQKSINSIESISAFLALDRPGPLDAEITDGTIKRNMLQEYAARARGEQPLDEIPFMTKELPETFGVMIYQEQLQRIYHKLSGCTGIEANKFREDISKKRVAKVNERYPLFMKNAINFVNPQEAQKIWDQIFTFGQYGFNKSHSISYAYITYASAFLKFFFPLEWWCSVLQNADKDEIATKFWKHCKHFVDMPEISVSRDNFIIHGDRIQAPINMLIGVGPKAQDELSKNRPYKTLQDFVDKINKQKKSSVRMIGDKEKKGTSALNRGVVGKLIVSGVMDSLFSPNQDTIAKLEEYETVLASTLGTKPQKINKEYRGLTPMKVYQYKKQILPVYTDNLQRYLYEMHIDGVGMKKRMIGNREEEVYTYLPTSEETIEYIKKSFDKKEFIGKLVFVDGKLLQYMDKEAIISPDEPLHVAIAAYVIDARPFNFVSKKSGKHRRAVEYTLDINGEITRIVRWDKKDGQLHVPENPVVGSIVIAILGRWNELGFSIESIMKVVEPLGGDKDEK